MAASSVAAAGAAVAVYFYNRRSPLFTCGAAPSADDDGSEQQPSEERAFLRHTGPNNWLEALYFFAEALRHDVLWMVALSCATDSYAHIISIWPLYLIVH